VQDVRVNGAAAQAKSVAVSCRDCVVRRPVSNRCVFLWNYASSKVIEFGLEMPIFGHFKDKVGIPHEHTSVKVRTLCEAARPEQREQRQESMRPKPRPKMPISFRWQSGFCGN